MIDKLRTRLASEEGFTLIELLVVMIILGILVAIAVPAYLSFTGKAKTSAAESNVRSAIPAAEAWYQDTAGGNGTYAGLNRAALVQEAPGIGQNVKAGAFNGSGTNSAYCIEDTEPGGTPWHYIGGDPGSTIPSSETAVVKSGTCASVVTGITVS